MPYLTAEETIKKIIGIWGAEYIIVPETIDVISSPGLDIPPIIEFIPIECTTVSGLLKQVQNKTGLIRAAIKEDGVIKIETFPYDAG